MKISDAEKKALKGRGYIMTRDGEHFVGRIITEDGVLTSEELMVAAEAAKKFGSGAVAMTSRMTVEVQGLTYETIEPFDQFLKERGLYTGGTGARVRPIVACKGTVCVHGLIDTQALARELHEKFYKGWYDVKLPHKFKIGIGGCPNNCVKPSLNDFGIMGQRMPEYDSKDCHGCGRCLASERCPVHAAHMENGVMEIDRTLCTSCGKCIDNCVFHTVSEKKAGYAVFVGGLWGKRQRMATACRRSTPRRKCSSWWRRPSSCTGSRAGPASGSARSSTASARTTLSPSSPATRFWPANSPFWTPLCSSGARAADPPAGARRLSSHALSCRQKGPSAGRAFSLAPPSAYPSNTL